MNRLILILFLIPFVGFSQNFLHDGQDSLLIDENGNFLEVGAVVVPGYRNDYYCAFNGVDQYTQFASDIDLGTTAMISFWVKRDNETDVDYFLGKSGESGGYTIFLNGLTFYYRVGVVKSFGAVLTDKLWHHIVIVRNGDRVDLYKDGAYVTNKTGYGAVNVSGYRQLPAPSNFFDGSIDELAGYNDAPAAYVATVPSEVTDLYWNGNGIEGLPENSGDPTLISNLVHFINFENVVSFPTIPDEAGSNDGTAVNTPVITAY